MLRSISVTYRFHIRCTPVKHPLNTRYTSIIWLVGRRDKRPEVLRAHARRHSTSAGEDEFRPVGGLREELLHRSGDVTWRAIGQHIAGRDVAENREPSG